MRHIAKADTAAQRDKLTPRAVFADGSVMVNALDSLMDSSLLLKRAAQTIRAARSFYLHLQLQSKEA